ncbi:hypothetical protein [Acaryochloris sp. CCMEE 5410]|uniref:hypothetical protein n=1 Tax=Acaryochloris sp. CCMEE 5410 TaxID=310037 RepID=UPI0021D39FC7|nr:hypothetical protein [Acaryochloris sp. CCMEE 5410]
MTKPVSKCLYWSARDEIQLLTSGPGCPGGQNTNIEGLSGLRISSVLKMLLAIEMSTSSGGREPYDTIITPNATSGIAVPEDVSSLIDILNMWTGQPAIDRWCIAMATGEVVMIHQWLRLFINSPTNSHG